MRNHPANNIYSFADDNLKNLVFTETDFKKIYSNFTDLYAKFYWISIFIIELNNIVNVYDTKKIKSLLGLNELNNVISQRNIKNNFFISSNRCLSEKQIRLIFYINSKLIPFVLEYYKELIKQLRMKHTEMKDEYLILFEKIPTFKYDGRVVRMFAFDVIADECKREKYLINVLQNFLMDVKNCKIQEKLIKDIEKVDYKLIELSILEIKLNRQQILRQDLSYDKIIVETKNNKGAVDKTQCELAEAITLFNCDLLEWTGSKPKLQYFSKLLQRYSIILDLRGVDSECETFMSIFKNSKGKPFGNKNPKPIQLSEGIKIADLAYIITKLKLDELISNSNSKVKTNKLFLNEHGKEIKYKSFRTSDKSDRKPRHKFEIDEIFSLLRKFGE